LSSLFLVSSQNLFVIKLKCKLQLQNKIQEV